MTGSTDFSSLVVMSKGTKFTQQSYKVAETFPFEWIKKKWKEGFHITSLATGGGDKSPQWAVVMSRSAGFNEQCIELDFQYPSEGIHRRWDAGSSHSLLPHHPPSPFCPSLPNPLKSPSAYNNTELCAYSFLIIVQLWVLDIQIRLNASESSPIRSIAC